MLNERLILTLTHPKGSAMFAALQGAFVRAHAREYFRPDASHLLSQRVLSSSQALVSVLRLLQSLVR